MYCNTTGNYNVAIGRSALYENVIGNRNVAVGNRSLSNMNGSYNYYSNVAVGYESQYSTTTGYYNTSLGTRSLKQITSAKNNTSVGHRSGYAITVGSGNTVLGYRSLANSVCDCSSYLVALGVNHDTCGNYIKESVGIGKDVHIVQNNQIFFGSTGSTLGTVTCVSCPACNIWEVYINGVVRRILLSC
jgi:hypothetical protein